MSQYNLTMHLQALSMFIEEGLSMFEGFTKPDSRYFRVPNDFIEVMSIIDSMAELKVILYIARHTWGFQEYEEGKKITIDEFIQGRWMRDYSRMDSGTGLSEMSVRNGLKKAIAHGFVECEYDDSDLARIKKYYRLKLKPDARSKTEPPKAPVIASKPNKIERLSYLQTMPYQEYLLTPEWQQKRIKALRFAQFRCQLCNSSQSLNVHHRTYERRGKELLGDLITLCHDCHTTFHWNRELEEDNGHGR